MLKYNKIQQEKQNLIIAILIVDDVDMNRFAIRKMTEKL